MELRTLQYFLAIAQEESITKAAENVLHVTQPTLSRQIAELEAELGTTLFMRTNKKTLLTEAGLRFRRYAQEIVDMMSRTQADFATDSELQGKISIGTDDFDGFSKIAESIKDFREKHTAVSFEIFSGNAFDVMEKLDSGVSDFGVLLETAQISRYDYIKLGIAEKWGLLVSKKNPLSKKQSISSEKIKSFPLIVPNQSFVRGEFSGRLGGDISGLNIVSTYNLMSTSLPLVENETGNALCLDKKSYHIKNNAFSFLPLEPPIETGLVLAWKKHKEFSRAAAEFLKAVKEKI